MRDEADRLAGVQGEGLEPVRSELARQERIVAELGMRVEREMVGGERDVGVE